MDVRECEERAEEVTEDERGYNRAQEGEKKTDGREIECDRKRERWSVQLVAETERDVRI